MVSRRKSARSSVTGKLPSWGKVARAYELRSGEKLSQDQAKRIGAVAMENFKKNWLAMVGSG